jgi:acetyl esterase/lipase
MSMNSCGEGLPAGVIAQIRAMDPTITPQLVLASWALLTPFHEKIGYQAPRIERDLRYGSHERNRLDVHWGGKAGESAPVVLFVHGGRFASGDKHAPGTPMYDCVGAWAVRHGTVGVAMTYRLAPESTWPSGAEDVARAVRWVRDNIVGYGGDPERIVAVGHSAGAVHVASFLAGQGGGSLDGIVGAALLSGIYQFRRPRPEDPEHAYYGQALDPATVSTLPRLAASPVPLLFSVAERDSERFHEQAAEVVETWRAKHGTVPGLVWVEGHNHISEIASLGIDEAALGTALHRFIARHTTADGA